MLATIPLIHRVAGGTELATQWAQSRQPAPLGPPATPQTPELASWANSPLEILVQRYGSSVRGPPGPQIGLSEGRPQD